MTCKMGTSIHIYNVNVSVKQKWQNSIVLLFHLRQETHEGEFFSHQKSIDRILFSQK